jgi:thioredoxin
MVAVRARKCVLPFGVANLIKDWVNKTQFIFPLCKRCPGREPGVNLETKEMVTDMANVMEFNTANFDSEVVGSDVPVLVDFWAPWCGPCKMIGPIIEELSGEFGDKVKIGKVNVDDNQELAGKFGIRGIPTVMLFKGGDVVNSFVGLRSKEDLAGALNDAL